MKDPVTVMTVRHLSYTVQPGVFPFAMRLDANE